MAGKKKDEARVQLHFGGAVIDVKESSAERYLAQGATKFDAKRAKADAKAAEDKRAAAQERRTARAEARPVVETPDPDTLPEPVNDVVKADPAVLEATVDTGDVVEEQK